MESVIFESFSWGNSMRNINSVSIDLLAEKPYISAHGGKLSVIKSKNHGNGIYSFELEDPRKKFIGTLRQHYEIKGKAVWFEDFSQNMLWSVSYGEKRLYFKVGGPSTN